MAFFCRARPLRPLLLGTLLPFMTALMILSGAAFFVHLTQVSTERDGLLNPAFPRAGHPFRIDLSRLERNGSIPPLLLKVTKVSRAPYAPGDWPVPSTVLQVTLSGGPEEAPLIINLHDAGGYLIRVRDLSTGRPLLSKSLRVVFPASFLGDSFLLLSTLALAGSLSGYIVKGFMPQTGRLGRVLTGAVLLELTLLLVFGALSRPPGSPEAMNLSSLIRRAAGPSGQVFLTLRQRVEAGRPGEWNAAGADRLLFMGKVDRDRGKDSPFFLRAEPGEVRVTVVTPRENGPGLRILRSRISRRPEEEGGKGRDLALFLGLVSFSGAFYVLSHPAHKS